MKIAGITGGIGAGKTIVSKVFQVLGVPVYDADSRARVLMNSDTEIIRDVSALFGSRSYKNGILDRAFIASIVFKEGSKLEKLNHIVHPRVARDFEIWQYNQQKPYVLKEAALIFETGMQQSLDVTIVVTAPQALRIKRVIQRDPQRSLEEIKGIMEKQMGEEEKVNRADYVILNDDAHLVIPQVLELHRTLVRL